MMNALVTASGSASAITVVNRLHALGAHVVACDLYPREWNEASMAADAFCIAPPASDAEGYIESLRRMVERYAIDTLIPLTDVEVDALCGQKAGFKALGCAVCTPEPEVARMCRDKRRMAEMLGAAGVCNTIPTFSPYGFTPDAHMFPLMLKPSQGRSSQGLVKADSLESYLAALKTRGDYIAQPYLEGGVLTVDVARDAFGHTQALVRKELLRTVNGLGVTVHILPEHPLEQIAERIASKAGITGVVNMEFIEHDGKYWFLEVNPRFSGGVGFSVTAGVDFVALAVACVKGEAIGTRTEVQSRVMTRSVTPLITD